MSIDTVRTEAPVDAWEIRHAALATWKATSHLSRTIAELERLEETGVAADRHVRDEMRSAAASAREALATLRGLRRYLDGDAPRSVLTRD